MVFIDEQGWRSEERQAWQKFAAWLRISKRHLEPYLTQIPDISEKQTGFKKLAGKGKSLIKPVSKSREDSSMLKVLRKFCLC